MPECSAREKPLSTGYITRKRRRLERGMTSSAWSNKKLSWEVLTPLLTPKLKALTSLKHLKHLSNKVVLNFGRGEEDPTLVTPSCFTVTTS